MFRLHILPRAVIYYTGEGIEDDDYSEMDEMDEFDEDYDEDDDEEEDEEVIDPLTSGDKRKCKGLANGARNSKLFARKSTKECTQQ